MTARRKIRRLSALIARYSPPASLPDRIRWYTPGRPA